MMRKKPEWCGYPMVKKIEDIFIRFDTMHERDRHTHTDAQTPHDGIGRTYAWRRAAIKPLVEQQTIQQYSDWYTGR